MGADLAAAAGRALAPVRLTAAHGKLIEASAKIACTPPCGEDMAFTHSVLCQVGLPRSKVEGREFIRQSGAAWVNVQAGWLDEGKGPVPQPVPYGPMPRLGLAWVSTFAVRHREREIPIGDSAAEFLRLMGMESDGRRYATLRKQMHALAAARLQLGFKGRTFNGQPVEQFDAWVSNKDSQQRSGSSAGVDRLVASLLRGRAEAFRRRDSSLQISPEVAARNQQTGWRTATANRAATDTMILFLDTEHTGFGQPAADRKLLSLALVAEDGRAEWYAEVEG